MNKMIFTVVIWAYLTCLKKKIVDWSFSHSEFSVLVSIWKQKQKKKRKLITILCYTSISTVIFAIQNRFSFLCLCPTLLYYYFFSSICDFYFDYCHSFFWSWNITLALAMAFFLQLFFWYCIFYVCQVRHLVDNLSST